MPRRRATAAPARTTRSQCSTEREVQRRCTRSAVIALRAQRTAVGARARRPALVRSLPPGRLGEERDAEEGVDHAVVDLLGDQGLFVADQAAQRVVGEDLGGAEPELVEQADPEAD